MKQGREYQGDDSKSEHASTHPGIGAIEAELASTSPSNYKCESQNQEEVPQNAPGNRGLDQAHQTRPQRYNRNNELGGVAKGGVQEPPDGGASTMGQVFGGLPHVSRQGQYAYARRGEDGECR